MGWPFHVSHEIIIKTLCHTLFGRDFSSLVGLSHYCNLTNPKLHWLKTIILLTNFAHGSSIWAGLSGTAHLSLAPVGSVGAAWRICVQIGASWAGAESWWPWSFSTRASPDCALASLQLCDQDVRAGVPRGRKWKPTQRPFVFYWASSRRARYQVMDPCLF